jgi:hypothetical protein
MVDGALDIGRLISRMPIMRRSHTDRGDNRDPGRRLP